ncbi:hypothetical protein ACH5RR_012982 [Cinchona calisaya]|uniref:Uncharacterized protein n=1 Tax=Cinchona calisaya TaxID=153742 RepID=A0ABD3A259_9GENT
MKLFCKAEGDFGRMSTIRDHDVMLPDKTLNLDELDTGEEDENNNGDNVGGANETFNVDVVQDYVRTEFGASWEPWR